MVAVDFSVITAIVPLPRFMRLGQTPVFSGTSEGSELSMEGSVLGYEERPPGEAHLNGPRGL